MLLILCKVIDIIHLNRELNSLDPDLIESISGINLDLEKSLKILKIYEKLGDNLCNLSLYELGLKNYQKQVNQIKFIIKLIINQLTLLSLKWPKK